MHSRIFYAVGKDAGGGDANPMASFIWFTDIKTWICNYIQSFLWDVTTPPCLNLNSGLAKLPLKYISMA